VQRAGTELAADCSNAQVGTLVAVASPIVLSTLSGGLTLTLDEEGVGGWCKVHLNIEGVDRELGAESLTYIATQLRSFLEDARPGRRWILALAELHTSAYGEHVPGKAIIDLQDGDATWFAKLVLTPTEKGEWMRELRGKF
jgi:hypothetical protein